MKKSYCKDCIVGICLSPFSLVKKSNISNFHYVFEDNLVPFGVVFRFIYCPICGRCLPWTVPFTEEEKNLFDESC